MEWVLITLLIGLVAALFYLQYAMDKRITRLKVAINLIVDDLEKLEALFEEDNSTGVGNTITSTAPLAPLLDDNAGNRRELESDGLPLQGHMIIVGQSGSGKSNIAKNQVIRRISSGQQLYLVDTKNELGPLFERHCVKVVGADGADKLFAELRQEAARRQQLFADVVRNQKKSCENIGDYQKLTGNKLPIITVVVEELIDLNKSIDMDKLVSLLVIGRSAGVFVLALAQLFRNDIIDRKGSANFNTKVFLGKFDAIAFRLMFPTASKQDQSRAMDYLGAPGKGYVEEYGEVYLHQFPQVEKHHVERWI